MNTIIFDMDGVIFDSERAVYLGWKELADKYGFKNLEIPYGKCIGVNAAKAKQIFMEYYGKDFPYDQYCREQSENYHAKYDGGRLPVKTGVKELLEYLKEHEYFVAIASSTRTALVEQQIADAGFTSYFDRIVGGDMVRKSKPEPDIFLKAIEGLEIKPENVIVIEDSYNGIRAAHRAGMIPIMVPDMVEPDDEMKRTAKAIVPNILKVKEYIEKSHK